MKILLTLILFSVPFESLFADEPEFEKQMAFEFADPDEEMIVFIDRTGSEIKVLLGQPGKSKQEKELANVDTSSVKQLILQFLDGESLIITQTDGVPEATWHSSDGEQQLKFIPLDIDDPYIRFNILEFFGSAAVSGEELLEDTGDQFFIFEQQQPVPLKNIYFVVISPKEGAKDKELPVEVWVGPKGNMRLVEVTDVAYYGDGGSFEVQFSNDRSIFVPVSLVNPRFGSSDKQAYLKSRSTSGELVKYGLRTILATVPSFNLIVGQPSVAFVAARIAQRAAADMPEPAANEADPSPNQQQQPSESIFRKISGICYTFLKSLQRRR